LKRGEIYKKGKKSRQNFGGPWHPEFEITGSKPAPGKRGRFRAEVLSKRKKKVGGAGGKVPPAGGNLCKCSQKGGHNGQKTARAGGGVRCGGGGDNDMLKKVATLGRIPRCYMERETNEREKVKKGLECDASFRRPTAKGCYITRKKNG